MKGSSTPNPYHGILQYFDIFLFRLMPWPPHDLASSACTDKKLPMAISPINKKNDVNSLLRGVVDIIIAVPHSTKGDADEVHRTRISQPHTREYNNTRQHINPED